MFGLIDGNSFYCSCERAFDPKLRGRALVVLSNNDGCVIARSDEAKDAGLKMGDPWHLVSRKPGIAGVVDWRSSNYALYGDMSRRVYELLLDRAPRVEPYSIDEMFLDLAGLPGDLVERCAAIRADVRRIAKIPTCVGIGPTKTIAKLANKVAKMDRVGPGVVDFSTAEGRALAYPDLPLGEVWGMGRASVKKLEAMGRVTVADFVAMPADLVRQTLTVTGLRTHAELLGVSCMPLTLAPPTRKSLAVTRSFGRSIDSWVEMREAVATYAARAAAKLRHHGLAASAMQVFMHTNPFNGDTPHAGSLTFAVEPSADSFALIGSAVRAAKAIFRPGFRYAKAGIVIVDLFPWEALPAADLFPSRDRTKSAQLMAAMDALNARYGRGTLRPGGTAPAAGWSMRRGRLSPRYTTALDEILEARA
jgi:DNA polymerase V